MSTTLSLTHEAAVAANAVAAFCLLETAARVEAVAVAVAIASVLPRVLDTAKELATAINTGSNSRQSKLDVTATHKAYRHLSMKAVATAAKMMIRRLLGA